MIGASDTAEHLRQWLESEGFTVTSGASGRAMDVRIPESDGRLLRIVELEKQGLLLFSMVVQGTVKRARWGALYPLLSDLNSQTVMGAWVLDLQNGSVYFRTSIPTHGVAYEPQALRDIMSHVVSIVGAMEGAFDASTRDEPPGDPVLDAWADEVDD